MANILLNYNTSDEIESWFKFGNNILPLSYFPQNITMIL